MNLSMLGTFNMVVTINKIQKKINMFELLQLLWSTLKMTQDLFLFSVWFASLVFVFHSNTALFVYAVQSLTKPSSPNI